METPINEYESLKRDYRTALWNWSEAKVLYPAGSLEVKASENVLTALEHRFKLQEAWAHGRYPVAA